MSRRHREELSRREISKELKSLADNELTPSPQFKATGEEATHLIVERLKQCGGFKIARSMIAGSMGKGTAVKDSDFDVIVVMNIDPPPYPNSLFERMNDCLESLRGYTFIRITAHCLQFRFSYKGYKLEFDLLPASNLVVPTLMTKEKVQDILAGRHPNISLEQAKLARRLMKQYFKKFEEDPYWFSSTLAEQTVLFFRKRQNQAIPLIKLAKHWNNQIKGMPYIPGRSYLMELIALEACRKNKGCSLIQRFINFLNLMKDFSNLSIFFGYYYRRSSIPEEILDQLPYVMDPINPYNNLCSRIKPRTMTLFEEHAKATLRKLEGPIYNVKKIFEFQYHH